MRLALLCGLVAVLPSTSAAQLKTIPSGTRVRIESDGALAVTGKLVEQTADSIIVTVHQARSALPVAAISRLRMSEGRSRTEGANRGMKIGAITLATSTALIMGTAYLTDSSEDKDPALLLAFIPMGGMVGALYGTVIGFVIGRERWTTVYLRPVNVELEPMPGGRFGVGAKIRF